MSHPAAPTSLDKLNKFKFKRLINEDPLTHSLILLGSFPVPVDGSTESEDVMAIVRIEKTALDPAQAQHLFADDGIVKRIALEESTDIYTWLFGWLGEDRERDIKINVICPATDIHIRKYTKQEVFMVRETPELYESTVKPYITAFPAARTQWVENILLGLSEQNKVLYSSPDFMILPDMKWDLKTISSLYLVALVQDRSIRTLRDLRRRHVSLLKAIRREGERVVQEKWALGKGSLRMYVHYQPSYLNANQAGMMGMTVGQAHLLDDIISLEPLRSGAPSHKDWEALKSAVNGRLFEGVPFAHPCFTQGFNSTECVAVQTSYVDEVARSNVAAAYIQTQWETCQTSDDRCLLSYTDPRDQSPTMPPNKCGLGSIPERFIDVRTAEDVAAAFRFSKRTKVPLVIKNTGHDYKGRSSAPRSLALWTHNLKDISYNPDFVPEGCSKANPGVTVGAGVQWGEAYAFAEAHNITIVGGSDRSVGVAGGWLQGGGHGALSNTMGLGVDRVLEFKVVTPDGHYRTANECQNKDLFFALRGGGGGTFGVVLESTLLASPQVTLQTVIVAFSPITARTNELWSILADNGLQWADEGWGGFSTSGIAILINPGSNKEAASKSMEPLVDFGRRLQREGVASAQVIQTEFPSWGTFFDMFTKDHVAVVGSSLALASRLISKRNFKTPANRSALVSGLLAADAATPGLIILISAPSSFPSTGQTSVTDAWRSSVYHVTVVSAWNWNATVDEKQGHYSAVSRSIDNLRAITADAAYLNEADVYEPNYQVAFWGEHYPELLRIKKKYDPHHLLDCWQCVGWNPKSPRFACYLPEENNVTDWDVYHSYSKQGFDIPIQRRVQSRNYRRRDVSGSTGLGVDSDVLYTVPVELGNSVAAVNIDTGSSDLWVVSDACQTDACKGSSVARYPLSTAKLTGTDVKLLYGDSTTGTFASGAVGLETTSVAGVAIEDQPFGLINATDNQIVQFQTAGILGLGFPSGSKIQEARVIGKFGPQVNTDDFIRATATDGPLLSRIAMTGELEQPMFSITLQRSTIDIGGEGVLTVGKLPDGVDSSSLTWVPVRLYDVENGGLGPPIFAPDEASSPPLHPGENTLIPIRPGLEVSTSTQCSRWEIDLDGVFLDGRRVVDSTIPPVGVNPGRITALIDTGNSILRGPEDMVNAIFKIVSPNFDPANVDENPPVPCSVPHTLAFQIGGKMFPVDPRDFIGPRADGDTTTCVADTLIDTDAPRKGSLYRWSLGDPFLKSNLVAFYYGNLTHPSVDPPRIGFLSTVPSNADDLLRQAVEDAKNNGAPPDPTNSTETLVVAPTASAAAAADITVSLPPTPSGMVTRTVNVDARPPTSTSSVKVDSENAAFALAPSLRFGFWVCAYIALLLLV
ncbi:hypothetical protein D9615_006755 [Tricholomella constricta]|uniref:FAD-binding PCMH-type domain-containing protein n=1 Tax=Tricholomella constricta TaxID=117010 RepID=A0A8H5M212_9AGAR|nr:hypothetical protein D9615_006755 [Tricholomella constricta]